MPRRGAQQTESAIREGRYFPAREAKRHTFTELVDRYLEAEARRKPHALPKLEQILGWWKAQLGAYSLAAITPAVIAEKRDALLAENIGKTSVRTRSAATANRYLAVLSAAFTAAVKEWHGLSENPLRRVSKESEPQGRVRYLAEAERTALLAACARSRLPELHLIVLLALTTGMRRGEILGLRWPDIDLKRRQLVLHKTKNSDRRSVTIVPAVADMLTAHGKVRRVDTDLVFARSPKTALDGRVIMRPLEIDHWFDLALSEAKITDFRFHDLRHTAASYLAMSGATPPEIAAVLGHRALQMVKRYAHLSDAHTGAVVERMTQKFFGS
jgi:integrase